MACCLTAPSHYLNQYWLNHQWGPVAFIWGHNHKILNEQLLSELNLLLTLVHIYGTCYHNILKTRCLCIILSHWYENGRVLLVVALYVRKSFNFVTVFTNLYHDICFFLDLLGYIWKTLLSLVAFYISTRLFLFYRLNLFIVICKIIYLEYLT